jgi:uncharacterized SAM-binding protein YcdF (DUF218 family)
MNSRVTKPGRRQALWFLGLLALLLLACVTVTAVRIVQQASYEDVRPADAIVVFGAAEYSGKPSPVFRARLDRAFELYEQGFAPLVITTGGAAADPHYSEGGVGSEYLIQRGLPENALIAETQASDTAQSAERVAVIMRTNGLKTCVAVSDEYHMFRVKQMLERQGVVVYPAPRPGSRPRSRWSRITAVTRESVSYLWWRGKNSF